MENQIKVQIEHVMETKIAILRSRTPGTPNPKSETLKHLNPTSLAFFLKPLPTLNPKS